MPCRVGDPGSEGLVEGTTLTRLPISRLTAGVIDIDILVVCEVIPQPLSREGDTPSHLTVLKLPSVAPPRTLEDLRSSQTLFAPCGALALVLAPSHLRCSNSVLETLPGFSSSGSNKPLHPAERRSLVLKLLPGRHSHSAPIGAQALDLRSVALTNHRIPQGHRSPRGDTCGQPRYIAAQLPEEKCVRALRITRIFDRRISPGCAPQKRAVTSVCAGHTLRALFRQALLPMGTGQPWHQASPCRRGQRHRQGSAS